MKKWLLICSAQYYPSAGTGDWIGTFETLEEAESMILNLDPDAITGPCKGGKTVEGEFDLKNTTWGYYNSYTIVNLEEWMN